MNYRFWLLLLGLASSASLAQPVFRIDSLPPQGVLLDKGWKWHAGDNPNWAKSDWDDSKWQAINPAKDIHELTQVRMAQIGWFRLRFELDSNRLPQPVALVILQIGASEIYLDGRLLYRFGVVSGVSSQEQTLNVQAKMYSLPLSTEKTHQLSVRYSFTKANFYHPYWGFNPGLLFVIQPVNQAHTDLVRWFSIQLVQEWVLAAIFLLLGATFLFFYFSFNTQRPYLFFGLYAFGQSIDHMLLIVPLYSFSTLLTQISLLASHIMAISSCMVLLVGAYALYARPKSWFFYGLLGYAVLTVPMLLLFYSWGGYSITCFYLIFMIDQLRQYWFGIKTQQAGAWTLFNSILIFYLFYLAYIVLNFTRSPLGYYFLSFGAFIVPLGFNFFLAGEFARTAHSLRKRVVEVEQLSSEKQQILTQQNETLERQVTERTTELNQSLTDLKTTQTQLIQKEKMASLGELTAGIAHEIQDPLNFVTNFSEVSTELVDELESEIDKSDPSEAKVIASDLRQNLQKITHHGGRASAIVKGMLEHARPIMGVPEPTDLNPLAEEYLRLAYQGFRTKNKTFACEVVTDLTPNLGLTNVVHQEIGRVLLNLYNNAFYAVGQRTSALAEGETYAPTVWISTHQLTNAIEIRLKDNGTGISDLVKAKVFQPFFTTKPTGEGTGLGLSLSYDIVTKGHGGTLAVESQEGLGTTFVIQLPNS
jgi:two-component system NtrC family sensor kinase